MNKAEIKRMNEFKSVAEGVYDGGGWWYVVKLSDWTTGRGRFTSRRSPVKGSEIIKKEDCIYQGLVEWFSRNPRIKAVLALHEYPFMCKDGKYCEHDGGVDPSKRGDFVVGPCGQQHCWLSLEADRCTQ